MVGHSENSRGRLPISGGGLIPSDPLAVLIAVALAGRHRPEAHAAARYRQVLDDNELAGGRPRLLGDPDPDVLASGADLGPTEPRPPGPLPGAWRAEAAAPVLGLERLAAAPDRSADIVPVQRGQQGQAPFAAGIASSFAGGALASSRQAIRGGGRRGCRSSTSAAMKARASSPAPITAGGAR